MKTVVSIEKNNVVGKIKPMHCVNNLPSLGSGFDELYKDLNIPYSRLHDTASMNPHLVDIYSVFPNFDADETDENSYDFAFTDYFIKKMQDLGSKPFYRLGVTIENYQAVKPYHIYPPKDNLKWAKISERIIMHYNEGWANGFHYGIEYWEIWNEPDNFPDIADNQMWKGTFEEYLALYEVASNYLKNRFPNLKIGGYASCGFYAILEEKSVAQAHVSSRTEYFVDCFIKFLKFITSKEHKSPLDFFSWHSYSGVKSNIKYCEYARKMLDEYGLTETENILNEWNPGILLRGELKDASNICANMLALQNNSLDMLMYYDIRITTSYCGIFNPVKNTPFPAYYTFKAFSELYKIGKAVKTEVKGSDNVYSSTAYDGVKGITLITNNSDEDCEIEISGDIKVVNAKAVNSEKTYEEVKINKNSYILKPYEVLSVYFE